MESANMVFIVLLFITVGVIVIACVVIFRRRRQAQSAADEFRRKPAEEKQRREVEKEAVRRAEEEERQRAEAERRRLEEELRRAEEELRRTEEERKRLEEEAHREAERARRKAEEGHRKPEELQKVEEETRREGEEAQRKVKEEERHKAEAESKRLEPEKRGGRSRVSTEAHEKQPAQETKSRRPKPEIVCWKRERQWVPAVEVPEEFLENPSLTALQNGSPLPPDESREACWRLEQAFGEVVVRWNEGEGVQETKVALGQEDYLLFKLSGQNQNQGRRVKSPSSGLYLVMVPDNWDRDEALSGTPRTAPEPVSLGGYKAHFFDLEKGGAGKIVFLTPSEPVEIEPKASRFELVGTQLNDANEDMGPLFGEGPPQLRAPDDQAWGDIGTIVVGEEGSGKGRWRKPFSPIPGGTQQDMPSEVAARKGGWYFLRFYDTNDDLIESLDFRFICSLKEIRMLQPSPLPSEDGHGLVCIMFLHEPDCAVQPADGLINIQIEGQNDKTILIIPSDPTYDETRWLVGPEGGPQVEVTVLVERLWWGIGEEHNAPSEWEDQPLILSRDDFAATSKKALWLRLPRRRWVDRVLVGFEQPKARPYDARVTEKTIAVPFREYGDSKEVGNRTQEHPFKVWIERDGRFMEGVVAVIPASKLVVAPVPVQVVSPPTPYWVGLGRKKTAIAKAVLQNGSGEIKINGQPIDRCFRGAPLKAKHFLRRLLELDQAHEALSQMEVLITVTGSSPTTARQPKAAAHALARALTSYDSKLKPLLKQAGFGGVRVTKVPAMKRKR